MAAAEQLLVLALVAMEVLVVAASALLLVGEAPVEALAWLEVGLEGRRGVPILC